MSVADKLATIAENEQKVYDAGYAKGQSEGGNCEKNHLSDITDWRYFFDGNNSEDGMTATRGDTLANLQYSDTSGGVNFSNMFTNCGKINANTNFTTAPEMDVSNGENFMRMFAQCSNLTTVPNLDTSKGTNFSSMFYQCSNLVNVGEIDTSNGTNFQQMFHGCSSLVNVPEIDTSNGTTFQSMFHSCSCLTEQPLVDVRGATSMRSMFHGCSSIPSFELDVSGSGEFAGMFQNCTKATSIILHNQTRSGDLGSMFRNCSSLIIAPELDTSAASILDYTFSGCNKLTKIPRINFTNFTSSRKLATYARSVFSGCVSLVEIGFEGAIHITGSLTTFLTASPNLDQATLHKMIDCFSDNSALSATYVVGIGSTNLAKISAEYLEIATAKNISLQ